MPSKKPATTDTKETTEVKKRVFRTAEERKADIDKKIAYHAAAIQKLEAKKARIGTGHRVRKPSFASVVAELKASGLKPEEILELLKKNQ